MKKIIFLSFVVASVLFTAYAEEAKTVEKDAAVKIKAEKIVAPIVNPKKPKPAECVEPAKPAAPAEPAKAALPAAPAKAAETAKAALAAEKALPAKAAEAAKPALAAEAAKPAPGICPPEAAKPEAPSAPAAK